MRRTADAGSQCWKPGGNFLSGIAELEKLDERYIRRMVNLTTRAPDIVAAILDDSLPNHITLFDLAVDPPAFWEEQQRCIK